MQFSERVDRKLKSNLECRNARAAWSYVLSISRCTQCSGTKNNSCRAASADLPRGGLAN